MSKVLKAFGEKVHALRIKMKLSQEELADLAGLHRTYIGQIESGKRNVALKNIDKISKALSVPIKNLFDFK